MRILICGGRFYNEEHMIRDRVVYLDPAHDVVIHGGCRSGADAIADKWARFYGLEVEVYLADWDSHGRAAGPIRNQRMLDEGKPDLVLAFWDGVSPGTKDMIKRAHAAGVPVEIVYQTGCGPKQGTLL